jgi:hypothetical protein
LGFLSLIFHWMTRCPLSFVSAIGARLPIFSGQGSAFGMIGSTGHHKLLKSQKQIGWLTFQKDVSFEELFNPKRCA